jgi:hypothetical protein
MQQGAASLSDGLIGLLHGHTRTHLGKPGRGGGFVSFVFEAPAGVAGLDDIAVVGQTVEHGGSHLGVAEDLGPIGEGEIGGDQQRGVLVELADQMEQELPAR